MERGHNLELSEVHPRRLPAGFRSQNIEHIKHMIPEPSLFEQGYGEMENAKSTESKTIRKPLHPLGETASSQNVMFNKNPTIPQNALYSNRNYSNMEVFQKENGPIGSSLPYQGMQKYDKEKKLNMDHDLSLSMSCKMFSNRDKHNESINSECLKIIENDGREKTACSIAAVGSTSKNFDLASELYSQQQVMKFISLQNEEINNLKSQVELLSNKISHSNSGVIESKQSNEVLCNENLSLINSQLVSMEILNPKIGCPHNSSKPVTTSNASTQTFSPYLPHPVAKITKDHKVLQQIGTRLSPSFVQLEEDIQEKSHNFQYQPIIINDLEAATPIIVNDLETSPVILSHHPSSDIYQPVDMGNMMGRAMHSNTRRKSNSEKELLDPSKEVKCVDLCPPEDIRKSINDNKRAQAGYLLPPRQSKNLHDPKDREPTAMGRMRDLGISFLKAEDFQQTNSKLTKGQEVDDYSMMWHPRAAEPSVASYQQCTSAESLVLNSTALKYLDDEQLTRVAKNTIQARDNSTKLHRANINVAREAIRSSELTVYGIPENKLSNSTIQYLKKNELMQHK